MQNLNKTSQKIPDNIPGHENVDPEDIANCPFMKMQSKKKTQEITDSIKSDEPRGGCPMMDVAIEKRSPPLAPFNIAHNCPYYSSMDFMFEPKRRGNYDDDGN